MQPSQNNRIPNTVVTDIPSLPNITAFISHHRYFKISSSAEWISGRMQDVVNEWGKEQSPSTAWWHRGHTVLLQPDSPRESLSFCIALYWCHRQYTRPDIHISFQWYLHLFCRSLAFFSHWMVAIVFRAASLVFWYSFIDAFVFHFLPPFSSFSFSSSFFFIRLALRFLRCRHFAVFACWLPSPSRIPSSLLSSSLFLSAGQFARYLPISSRAIVSSPQSRRRRLLSQARFWRLRLASPAPARPSPEVPLRSSASFYAAIERSLSVFFDEAFH